MRKRTFEEMITYFNQTVSGMDIDRKYKMTLLGIVTALLQKHDEDVAEIVRCKDCKWYKKNYSWNGKEFKICVREPTEPARRPDDFCSYGERKDG